MLFCILQHASARRPLIVLALALACAGPVRAQALAGPRPSALWLRLPSSDTTERTGVRVAKSQAGKRLLIGAVVGGLVGGLVGHKMCRTFGSSGGDGCVGDTLWWGTAAALLGGLIGASSAEDVDR